MDRAPDVGMAVYQLYANRRNTGDFLSALAIRKLLRCSRRREFHWSNGRFDETRAAIASLDNNDVLVVGGGGLFKDFFQGMWEAVLENSNVQLLVWGVGICDEKHQDSMLSSDLLAKVAERSAWIGVRDVRSKAILDSLGQESELVGCPSLILAKRWQSKRAKHILHAIHPLYVTEDRIREWRACLESLAERLGLGYVETQHILPTRRTVERMRARWEHRTHYRDAALVVTSRLHGAIFGAAAHKPVVAISGDRKMEAMWEETLGGRPPLDSKKPPNVSDWLDGTDLPDVDADVIQRIDQFAALNRALPRKLASVVSL